MYPVFVLVFTKASLIHFDPQLQYMLISSRQNREEGLVFVFTRLPI